MQDSTKTMQDGRILTVCLANICRSPAMAFLLRVGFSDALGVDIEVSSAGTSVVEGRPACPTMAGLIEVEGWPEFSAGHTARLLSREAVDEAALIITADDSGRSAVAVLSPQARERTFMLAEAVALAEHAASRGKEAVGLTEVARVLHAQRGRVVPAPAAARRWRRRRKPADWNVRDAHTTEASHASVADVIINDCDRLAAALRSLNSA